MAWTAARTCAASAAVIARGGGDHAAGPDGEAASAPERAVGVLHDVTTRQRVLDRVDNVDAAGADLLALDAKIVNPLNVAERLGLIEGKIVEALERLFGTREFEVRLLDAPRRSWSW